MNGFWLLLPFLAVRFLLLRTLDKKAVRRAAHFAPMKGNERIGYYIYQISNTLIFLYLFFLQIKVDLTWQFYLGMICYLMGLGLCAASVASFASPDKSGLNVNGIYRFSRNPMYVAYFICFMGMSLLTQSVVLFGVILVFQASAHWIILAEERECREKFGEDYIEYMKRVRRYI